MTAILPTRSKATLSSRTTYPIGAQAISRLLADVPQFAEITLEFASRDHLLLRGPTDELLLMEANHFRRPKTMFDGPATRAYLQQPHWNVTVHSVLRSDARAIREVIEAPQGAGAQVGAWFMERAELKDARCNVSLFVTAVRGRSGFTLRFETFSNRTG